MFSSYQQNQYIFCIHLKQFCLCGELISCPFHLRPTERGPRSASKKRSDSVNKDNLAVFDAEFVGVGRAHEVVEYLNGANCFINNVVADVWVNLGWLAISSTGGQIPSGQGGRLG
jgi:hypothetical protein